MLEGLKYKNYTLKKVRMENWTLSMVKCQSNKRQNGNTDIKAAKKSVLALCSIVFWWLYCNWKRNKQS